MTEARRKFWGWGLESETLSEADAGRIARRVASLTGLTPGPYTAPPALDELDLPRAAGRTAGCAGRPLLQRCLLPREPYLRQVVPGTTSARGDGISPWRRMSSLTPRTRRTSWRCSTGRAMRGSRLFPMARGRPWWGASSPASGTVLPASSPSTWAAWTRCWRSTGSPARPAFRAACSGPRSKPSSSRRGSRSGTSRSPSASPPSAAGSPPAPAATTPRSTPTSTSSWRVCAR